MNYLDKEIRTEIITTIDQFEELKTEWTDLLNRCFDNDLFLTWEWNYSWWKNFPDNKELRIVCFYLYDRLVAILPLYMHKTSYYKIPVKELALIGDVTSDRQVFLVDKNIKGLHNAVLKYLISNPFSCNILRIDQIPMASELARVIQSDFNKFETEISTSLPFITITENWEDFNSKLSRKFRSELRTRTKYFDTVGDWKIEQIKGDSLTQFLPEIIKTEKSSQKTQENRIFFNDDAHSNFIETLLILSKNNYEILVFILVISHQVVAYLLGFLSLNKFLAYNMAFLPEHQKGSPGKYLLNEAIKYCFEQQLQEFDFLRGDTYIKMKWQPEIRKNIRALYFYDGLVPYFLKIAVFRIRPFLKKYILKQIDI